MAEKTTDKKEEREPQSGKRRESGDESLIPRSASILIMLISAAVALGAIAMLQTQSNEPEAEQRDERTEEKTIPAPPAAEKRLFPVSPTDRRFTVDELRAHGPTASTIYLAIFGRVYDVTKGKQHYGKKGGYSFFAGRDATRSFVSGDFTDAGLTDDLTGLSPDLMLGIEDWVRTYEKDYTYVGILVGRFYDANGRATEALRDAERRIGDGHAARAKENDLKRLFPPCNSRWAAGSGEVWCTTKRSEFRPPEKLPMNSCSSVGVLHATGSAYRGGFFKRAGKSLGVRA